MMAHVPAILGKDDIMGFIFGGQEKLPVRTFIERRNSV
jgi:hypothetical protein